MADAVGTSVSVRLRRPSHAARRPTSRATGKTITYPGFLRAYVERATTRAPRREDAERRLPGCVKDQPLTAAS